MTEDLKRLSAEAPQGAYSVQPYCVSSKGPDENWVVFLYDGEDPEEASPILVDEEPDFGGGDNFSPILDYLAALSNAYRSGELVPRSASPTQSAPAAKESLATAGTHDMAREAFDEIEDAFSRYEERQAAYMSDRTQHSKVVAGAALGHLRRRWADYAQYLRPADSQTGLSFQDRVQPWMMACFGPEISADKLERNDRFIEEALELVQASGYPKERAHELVEYVYGRDQGEINQEVGGVMVTLAAHCLAHGVDMHAAAETELARIWTKVDQIRAKQAAKPTGSALPIATLPADSQDGRVSELEAEVARLGQALIQIEAMARSQAGGGTPWPNPQWDKKQTLWNIASRANAALDRAALKGAGS